MNAAEHEIHHLIVAGRGVIARGRHPELAAALDLALRRGQLVPVLPGIYTSRELRDELAVRLRAAMIWDPNAVVTGRAAAKLTFWPDLPAAELELAVPGRKGRHRGWDLRRRRIPADLIDEVDGIRCTSAALTALDLCLTELGGNAIDTALRTGAATLDQLHEALALSPPRRGTVDQRQLLIESRDEPWSEAERDLHRMLHDAELVGWKGNLPFRLPSGSYRIDVAFRELKLAIEVDGWEFHNTKEAFERDRRRQNDLVLAGWTVLRFTAIMIRDEPDVVLATIRAALAMLTAR